MAPLKRPSETTKWLAAILTSILIAIFFEIAIFNYQSLETLTAPKKIAQINDSDPGCAISLDFSSEEECSLPASGNLTTLTLRTDSPEELQFQISITDEGNQTPYEIGRIAVSGQKTIKVNPSGKIRSIQVRCPENASSQNVITVSANDPIPFDISKRRLIAIAVICLIAFTVGTSSPLVAKAVRRKRLIQNLYILSKRHLLSFTMRGFCRLARHTRVFTPPPILRTSTSACSWSYIIAYRSFARATRP